MRAFHKSRWFRPRHGYEFPMIPRRIGMAMTRLFCHYPMGFVKWHSRMFYSRYDT